MFDALNNREVVMSVVGVVVLWALVATHLETAVGQEQYCASGFEPGFAPKYCIAGACGAAMFAIPARI